MSAEGLVPIKVALWRAAGGLGPRGLGGLAEVLEDATHLVAVGNDTLHFHHVPADGQVKGCAPSILAINMAQRYAEIRRFGVGGSGSSAGPSVAIAESPSVWSAPVSHSCSRHERGAFTGALGRRAGAFVQADGGTLFLDEIGELPLDLQPRLLRVLDSGEVRLVGGAGAFRVDVRVVAATNRDLVALVGAGEFRADLFYRLRVIEVGHPEPADRLN